MKTLVKDYGLRFYERNLYVKNAGKRGGEIFRPLKKRGKVFSNKSKVCSWSYSKSYQLYGRKVSALQELTI